MLALDQGLEFLVESGKVGMLRNGVKRGMIALVALVFPNVDF
jgi:hypothetical protein